MTGTVAEAAEARKGPLWTRARLQRVLRLRFGVSARGRVDVEAVAQAMGVTTRTVQRWLAGSSGRSVAHIPPRRLQQLIALLLPSEETLRDEARAAEYARNAISQLGLGRNRGILPSWEKRRWLENHLVAVIAIKDAGIRQLAVTRTSAKASEQLGKRGRVVDFVVVPTRFHATVLTHAVLTELGPWRFRALPGTVKQAPTLSWLDDAPATNLSATMTRAQLR
ncbi:hypothetical protein GCM10009616_34170 [Microlunatus lacustris]